MINEYDKVRIIKTGIIGEVIDIYTVKSGTFYTVEQTNEGFVRFTCKADELEKIK